MLGFYPLLIRQNLHLQFKGKKGLLYHEPKTREKEQNNSVEKRVYI